MSPDPDVPSSPRGRARPGRLALIFDGGCPKCRASIRALMALAASDRIEAIDLQDASVAQRFPNFHPDDLMREIHAIDDTGRIWRGADAIREALSRQAGIPRAISWMWRVPGFESIADYLYRRIAASRHREDPAQQPHCPLG